MSKIAIFLQLKLKNANDLLAYVLLFRTFAHIIASKIRNAMPSITLPIGFHILSLKADINDRCCKGGPFRHTVEYQLERYAHAETRARASFKITQMCMVYTSLLMKQFPELEEKVSSATFAMEIREMLIRNIQK